MDQLVILEMQKWHNALIIDLQNQKISRRDANVKVVEKMAEWFGSLTREETLGVMSFKDSAYEYNQMKPFLYHIILNNKVIDILLSLKSANAHEVDEAIASHYQEMLEVFKLEHPIQQRFDWTYGINPRLSKLYRQLK